MTSKEVIRFLMISLLVIPLGDRFCVNRKGGTAGSGWAYSKGENSTTMSGLGCTKALVGTGWAISLLLYLNGLRKCSGTERYILVWMGGH